MEKEKKNSMGLIEGMLSPSRKAHKQPEPSGALLHPPMAPATLTQSPSPPRPHYDERELLTLSVPYFCQRDSATWQGHRMCFSSTCAMASAFLKPGCLAGGCQPDDGFLALVERFGDTTSSQARGGRGAPCGAHVHRP